MNIELYINDKKIKFTGSFGWYKGEEFSLFKLELLQIFPDDKVIYFLDFQIAKFLITLGIDYFGDN